MSVLKLDYEKDMVYLYQFPRARCAISLSPYCLKMETWLRMADIAYENIDNGFTKLSKKKLAPFVEFNGRHLADSEDIIAELTRTLLYFRTQDIKGNFFTKAGWLDTLPKKLKFLLPIVAWQFARNGRAKLAAQGYGSNTWEETVKICKTDLKALSQFLGKKKYMLGDQVSTLDATCFGSLAQVTNSAIDHPCKQFMKDDCPNLVQYVDRIKKQFWPDWDKDCALLTMTSDWK